MKYMELPTEFLRNSGLLFEINRCILHPLGLAMAVVVDEAPTAAKKIYGQVMILETSDPEGWIFDEKTQAEGFDKLQNYMEEFGHKAIVSRLDSLGYIVQGEDDLDTENSPVQEPTQIS